MHYSVLLLIRHVLENRLGRISLIAGDQVDRVYMSEECADSGRGDDTKGSIASLSTEPAYPCSNVRKEDVAGSGIPATKTAG